MKSHLLKLAAIKLALLLTVSAAAQSKSSDPFKDADLILKSKAICVQLGDLAKNYNRVHPEAGIEASMCGLSRPMIPKGTHEVRHQLTAKEIDRLDYLRAKSTVAYSEEHEFEDGLLRSRGLKPFDERDESLPYTYVGIKVDDHFITEEVINK